MGNVHILSQSTFLVVGPRSRFGQAVLSDQGVGFFSSIRGNAVINIFHDLPLTGGRSQQRHFYSLCSPKMEV